MDNSLYQLPAEPVVTTVVQLANKVQATYGLLGFADENFPTVDGAVAAESVSAWNRLASSTAAVVEAYGQIAAGTASSSTSQALAEMAYFPRISIEAGTFSHLNDSGLIFATAGANALLSSGGQTGFGQVLSIAYPAATGLVSAYVHLWYANLAGEMDLRAGVMISSFGRSTLQRIQQLESAIVYTKGRVSQLADEVAQAKPNVPQQRRAGFGYKQNARSAFNFYAQDARIAEVIVAEDLGFVVADGEWADNNALYQKYKALNADLSNAKIQRDRLVRGLANEKARLLSVTGVSVDRLTPEHVLKMQRTTSRWAAAGIVVAVGSAGFSIGMMLANGQIQPDSPQFSQFLAEQIAGVIVDVFYALLDVLIVVGNVARLGSVLAVIAVIDAIFAVVCAATKFDQTDPVAASWICGGISGAIAKALSYVINDTTPLVDFNHENRLAVGVDTPALGSETGVDGLVVGNSITISGSVTNTLYMDNPNWIGYLYWWQWTDQFLDDATFAYQFQSGKQDIPLDLNGTTWDPVPGKKNYSVSANDARFRKELPIQSYAHTFTQPGINQALPVNLAEGFAVRKQNCWLTVIGALYTCWLSKYDDTVHQSMENTFIFDVWPASIDDLRAMVPQPNSDGDNGYRLAWDAQFPTLADADGDGLRSQALDGPDPDDGNPDTDVDGLPDAFEIATAGYDPSSSDTDCDGLTDYWERFFGTDPALPDTDGDGLTDNEEHFHLNQIYPYDGGVLENYASAFLLKQRIHLCRRMAHRLRL